MEDKLHKNGFVFLKNILSKNDIETGITPINDKALDYQAMESFVKNVFLDKINTTFGWSTIYTKFRVSDNNNSVDASAFHRDIFPINKATSAASPPIYTILTYFDKTIMEVIPGSHNETNMSYTNAIKRYFDAIRLIIEPGDMLIFHATLLHRGIFTEGQTHRRVLQVFDCYPSKEIFDQYNEQICHIPGKRKYQNIMLTVAKNPFFIFFSNIAGFFNSATGHGSHLADMQGICNVDKYLYLSSEGLTERANNAITEQQPLNKYYLREKVNDLPLECYNDFKYAYYNKQFILYFIIFICLFIGTIITLYKNINFKYIIIYMQRVYKQLYKQLR